MAIALVKLNGQMLPRSGNGPVLPDIKSSKLTRAS
jgi:hypothetical protein